MLRTVLALLVLFGIASALLILPGTAVPIVIPAFTQAASSASPRIAALRQQLEAENKGAVAEFWRYIAKNHAPLIEPYPADGRSSLVTFVWQAKGETRNVVVFGGFTNSDVAASQMSRLGNTDVWHKTYIIRNDARFTYLFSPNDSLESLDRLDPRDTTGVQRRFATTAPDPLNPREIQQGRTLSYVELNAAPPQPWIAPVDGPPRGTVIRTRLHSAILSNERAAWVYIPSDFTAGGDRYPLLVVFDGIAYVNLVPVPVILDNLIAKKRIPPMVAIMIAETSRNTELPCYAPFADFLAKEAVPWMRENYHATSDAGRTFVAGSSYGGLAAAYAALRYPEIFGNVLSQSGSFWWTPDHDPDSEWLTRQYVASPRLPVRFFLEVGLMESGPDSRSSRSQVGTNRHMRDVLTAKGYTIHYQEFNGDHTYLNWRGSLAGGLIFLAGK